MLKGKARSGLVVGLELFFCNKVDVVEWSHECPGVQSQPSGLTGLAEAKVEEHENKKTKRQC